MAVLSELVELLKRWDVWKRIEATPDKVEALEKRIAALEDKLSRAPGEACPKCGTLEFRVESTKPHPDFGDMGVSIRQCKCGACGFTEQRRS